MDKMYTIKDLMEILNVDRVTIYRWIKEGKLKVYKLSKRSIRISQTQLDDFLEIKGVYDNG